MDKTNFEFFDDEQKEDLIKLVDKAFENQDVWRRGCDQKMERKFLDLSEYFNKNIFNNIMYYFPKIDEDVNSDNLTELVAQIEDDVTFFKNGCPEWAEAYKYEKPLETIIFRAKSNIICEDKIYDSQIKTKMWLKNFEILLKRLEKNHEEGEYEQIFCIS